MILAIRTSVLHIFKSKLMLQLLEEARNNASKGNSKTTIDEQSVKAQFNGQEKCRKTWRTSLFTWLKTERKIKSNRRQMDSPATSSKPRTEHVSGPVWGSIRNIDCGRALKAVSGPLTHIFSSTRGTDEYHVPYTPLAQKNNARSQIHHYGPIYSVT